MESFYATLSQIAFTILGLWWVVVQFKYDLWKASPGRRTIAGAISAHYVALGLVAVVAAMSGEVRTIWRAGTLLGGLFGAGVSVWALSKALFTPAQRIVTVLSAAVFVVVLVLTFIYEPLFGLTPVMLNAICDVILLGLGLLQTWLFMMEDAA